MRARLRLTAAAILCLTISGTACLAGTPIVAGDLLRIRTISSIDVDVNGTLAVLAVQSIAPLEPDSGEKPGPGKAGRNSNPTHGPADDSQPRYANASHLFLLELNKAEASPRQLTFGSRTDRLPMLSPDARRIAFLRSGVSGEAAHSAQVWVMPLDGGEAWQVTNFEHGVESVQWSADGSVAGAPGGRRLIVTAPVDMADLEGAPPWPGERPGRSWRDEPRAPSRHGADKTREPSGAAAGPAPDPDGSREQIRAWLDHNAQLQNPVVITRLNFQEEQSLRGPMRFLHLFAIDPDAHADQPDAGNSIAPRRITSGFFDHRDAVVMPDGRRIVYAARKTADQHPDRVLGTDLWRINIDGSDDRLLLAIEGWSLSRPRPSRDGSVIAYVGQKMDEPAFRQRVLGMAAGDPAAASPGGAPPSPPPAWLTDDPSFDGSVMDFQWTPATGGLVFNTARNGSFPLMTINPGLLTPAALWSTWEGEPIGVQAVGVGGAAIVGAVTTPGNPCRLLVRDARGDRMAADLNRWASERDLIKPREAWITQPDGTKVQYWVMEPIHRKPGEKYPLVVELHGGPSAMWGPGEQTMWHEFQLLCSRGYGVMYANPRGSGGYGYAFQKANFQNWGDGPAADVLAALDDAVGRNDWIDRNRMVLTGGSYGGYLTAWIIAHDNRFKAAVAQRGVYDLAAFFGEGNAWRLVEWAFGGYPFDARFRELIQRSSPFIHVQRIRTPLLIMHGSTDLRTGVSQSEMLYRALKALNKPVEYVRYPAAGHDQSRNGDPTQRMDRLNRIIEFFDRYIATAQGTPPVGRP